MAKAMNMAIIAGVVVAAAAVVMLKQTRTQTIARGPDETESSQSLPRLVDLGAKACIPCKMMAPILDELKKEYSEIFETEFIDVWQDEEPARKYGIRVIPTQIFFDAEGRELFRHEGFFAKEDILAKWKELGVDTER